MKGFNLAQASASGAVGNVGSGRSGGVPTTPGSAGSYQEFLVAVTVSIIYYTSL